MMAPLACASVRQSLMFFGFGLFGLSQDNDNGLASNTMIRATAQRASLRLRITSSMASGGSLSGMAWMAKFAQKDLP